MADRLLAVCTVEKAPLRSELVDIRCDRELGAIAAELRTEVIDCDEKDIRLLLR